MDTGLLDHRTADHARLWRAASSRLFLRQADLSPGPQTIFWMSFQFFVARQQSDGPGEQLLNYGT